MKQDTTTVLLVEDNLADARYTETLLPTETYNFIEAKSLAQALAFAQDKHIDVVLLDLSLPDSSGLETVIELVAKRAELPIVVLTGIDDITFAIEALRVGAHDYIVKARLNPDALARSISYAIETKRRQQIEERLMERTRVSNLSATIGQSLSQVFDPEKMLAQCTDAVVANLNVIVAQIWIVDKTEKTFTLKTSSNNSGSAATISNVRIFQERLDQIETETRASMMDHLLLQDHIAIAEFESPNLQELRTFATHPLLVQERLIGALSILSKEPLSEIDSSGLALIANQIAMGIDRRKAEEARTMLATIVQCSGDAIISQDVNGIVLSWNRAAEKIFGYRSEEIIGKNISILMVGAEALELSRVAESLDTEEAVGHLETKFVHQNGVLIDVALSMSPTRTDNGIIIGASSIIRNITEKRRTERLAAAQTEVTHLLSQSGSSTDAEQEIIYVLSKAVEADFGGLWFLDREENSQRCSAVWHENDESVTEFANLSKHVSFPRGLSLPGRILQYGKPVVIEDLTEDKALARLPAAKIAGFKNAIAFPIAVGDRVLGTMEFFARKKLNLNAELTDVMVNIGSQIGQFIDRKHAEKLAQDATAAQLGIGQAIMENAPIGIAWLDQNLVVSKANRAFGQQLGLDSAELPGRFIFQIPSGLPNTQFVSVLKSGIPFSTTSFRTFSNGGTMGKEFYFDLTIWPVKDSNDRSVGLVLLTVDVTERVRLSKQREDFVATLTHDLKNPLIAQNLMLDLLLKQQIGPVQGAVAESLSLLKTGTEEQLDLIGTLLDVYRYEEGAKLEFEQVDLEQVLRTCVVQFTPLGTAKDISIKLENNFDQECWIKADPLALKRVVSNLLDNAIKFTPEGGVVKVSYQISESGILLTVQDNGEGMEEEELKLLFQRFSQTRSGKKYKAGTGLGLFLCRQIVEAHGGTIACVSMLGVGSTFAVTFPLSQMCDAS